MKLPRVHLDQLSKLDGERLSCLPSFLTSSLTSLLPTFNVFVDYVGNWTLLLCTFVIPSSSRQCVRRSSTQEFVVLLDGVRRFLSPAPVRMSVRPSAVRFVFVVCCALSALSTSLLRCGVDEQRTNEQTHKRTNERTPPNIDE